METIADDESMEMSLRLFAEQAFQQMKYDTFTDQNGYHVLMVDEGPFHRSATEPLVLRFSLYVPEYQHAIATWTLNNSLNEETLAIIANHFAPGSQADQVRGKATM